MAKFNHSIATHQYEIDVCYDQFTDFLYDCEIYGINVTILAMSGPGGGNPNVIVSHHDLAYLNAFISKCYDDQYETVAVS